VSGGKQRLAEYESRRGQATRAASELRQNLVTLVDEGSFTELDLFAGVRVDDAQAQQPATDIGVTGFGTVAGGHVALFGFSADLLQGALAEVIVQKIGKAQDVALTNRVPVVGWLEAGAPTDEGIVALAGWARLYAGATRASGSVPQVTVVDAGVGGPALHLAELADFTIAVGEPAAGARVDFQANAAADASRVVERVLTFLPASCDEPPPFHPGADDRDDLDSELQRLLPVSGGTPDVGEVLTHLLDGGDFLEVQGNTGLSTITGFGRLAGNSVGIVANQQSVDEGRITVAGATKAARFIRFCDAFGIPLVFLVDTPGFSDEKWIVRHGSQMLAATAEATVPKLSVVIGRALGLGYAAMGAKQAGGDVNVAWPTADLGAAGDSGSGTDHPALQRGYVDDVIEPGETRRVLARALTVGLNKTVAEPARKHTNIPI
jgi:propionyl-CoA carboxylase beta chain